MTNISEADLKTIRQMKAAGENAVYLWKSDDLDTAQALAANANRNDLRILPATFLNTAKIDNLKGLVIGSPIVIDSGVMLTIEQRENMMKLGAMGILFSQTVPAEQPTYVAPSHEKIVAETITWTLNGTGLTLRDVRGRRLGTLKLSGVEGHNDQAIRANSEALIERIRVLISEENSTTAFVLPQHR